MDRPVNYIYRGVDEFSSRSLNTSSRVAPSGLKRKCPKSLGLHIFVQGYVTPCVAYKQVVHGKHKLNICPPVLSSSFCCLLLLCTSLFLGAVCPFVVPPRTVIGNVSTRFLFLFLRLMKTRSRNTKPVTKTPPKKLPTAIPTELILLLDPSPCPDERKQMV